MQRVSFIIIFINLLFYSFCYAEQDKKLAVPVIGTSNCSLAYKAIAEDYNERRQGKRNDPYNEILSSESFEFLDSMNFVDKEVYAVYLGDPKYFSKGNWQFSINLDTKSLIAIDSCTVKYDGKNWSVSPVDGKTIKVSKQQDNLFIDNSYNISFSNSNIETGVYIVAYIATKGIYVPGSPKGKSILYWFSISDDFDKYNMSTEFIVPNSVKHAFKIIRPENNSVYIEPAEYGKKEEKNSIKYSLSKKQSRHMLLQSPQLSPNFFSERYMLSTFPSWSSIIDILGVKFDQRVEEGKPVFDNMLNDVAQMFKLNSVKEIKPAHIYYFVRDRFRYLFAATGLGGWVPHNLDKILKNKYGDCKDHTLLLVGLLRSAGYRAYPLLLNSFVGPAMKYGSDLPYINFNHMIACYYEGDGLNFIDAVAKDTSFGYLPGDDEGKEYYVLKANDVVHGVLPVNRNQYLVLSEQRLSPNGDYEFVDVRQVIGPYGEWMKSTFSGLPEDQIKEAVRTKTQYYINTSEILNAGYIKSINKDYREVHALHADVRIRKYMFKVQDLFVFGRIYQSDFNEQSIMLDEIKTPIQIPGHVNHDFYRIRYVIPKSFGIRKKLPETFDFDGKFFTYKKHYYYNQDENAITVDKEYITKTNIVWPDEYPDFKSEVSHILKMEEDSLVVEEKTDDR